MSPSDFKILRILLPATAVGAPLLMIGGPLIAWLTGRSLSWTAPVSGAERLRPAQVAGNLHPLEWDGVATFTVPDPTTMDRLIALTPDAVLAAAIAIVVLLLHRLIDRIRAGDPFGSHGARSLRTMALTIFAAAVLWPMFDGTADQILANKVLDDDHQVGLRLDFPLLPLAIALVVLALAHAFTVGARLRHDVDGLV